MAYEGEMVMTTTTMSGPAHRDVMTLSVAFLAFWMLFASLFAPWFKIEFSILGGGGGLVAEESAAPFDDVFPKSKRIKGSKAMLILAVIFCAFGGVATFARNSFVTSLCLWGSATAALAGLMLYFQELKAVEGMCEIKAPGTGVSVGSVGFSLWNPGTVLFLVGGLLVLLSAVLSMRHSPAFARNSALLLTIFASVVVIVVLTTQPDTDTCDYVFFG